MTRTRCAVIGAGGIGAVLTAGLARTGAEVTVCTRSPITGLRVTGPDGEVQEVAARCTSDLSSVDPVGLVFVATKVTDTVGAGPWLARLCAHNTVVVVAQNGLDRVDAVASLVRPEQPLLPVLLYVAAERTEPGRVTHYGGDGIVAPPGPNADRLAGHLRGSGLKLETTIDFHTAAWRKLLANSVVNPITALTGRRIDVMNDPDVADVARALLMEAIAVGRADGADLDDRDVERVLSGTGQYGVLTGSSMLYDRLAGRRLEHEALTGEVVRRGLLHGMPVPLNRAVLALLQAVNTGGSGAY